jgi:DHA1 family bicyclomycin/chloramphenicol resistance-like MFS transporter
MARGLARVALVVGPLAALGPFAIDMYLPALPAVAADLGASVAAVQVTLTAFFLAFGACQLVYGPTPSASSARRSSPLPSASATAWRGWCCSRWRASRR